MAQTVGQTSFRNAVIEYSTDGTNWVGMSGVSNKIDPSGGDRQQGEEFTGEERFVQHDRSVREHDRIFPRRELTALPELKLIPSR